MRFEAAGLTDVGRRRAHNEDDFVIRAEAGLLAVADGMGGHDAGEVASRMAVEGIERHVAALPGDAGAEALIAGVSDAVRAIGHDIFERNRGLGYPEGMGMGTTLTGLWLPPGAGEAAILFNVGDSRVYRLRGGALEQVSKDQSAYQEWLDGGSVGPAPGRNIIAQALGPSAAVEPAVDAVTLAAGDVVLLCSDGLNDMLEDAAIAALLREHADPDGAAQALVAAANAAGGADNITVIVARCVE